MKNSIITPCTTCFICGNANVEKHHVFYGIGNRDIADKYGLFIYLCPEHHRGADGVHGKNGHELDQMLKQKGQRAFERRYTHDEFMNLFMRNYL